MNIFTLPQSAGGVLLGVAILLTAGFLMTRLTRRLHLPNVTGYILAGILVGPYALNLIPAWLSGGMNSSPISRSPISRFPPDGISVSRI